jgi:hypothetical protein
MVLGSWPFVLCLWFLVSCDHVLFAFCFCHLQFLKDVAQGSPFNPASFQGQMATPHKPRTKAFKNRRVKRRTLRYNEQLSPLFFNVAARPA